MLRAVVAAATPSAPAAAGKLLLLPLGVFTCWQASDVRERKSASPQHTNTMCATPPKRRRARVESSNSMCSVAGAF
eukprot:450847-Pyramimonas_sp.AAC.1